MWTTNTIHILSDIPVIIALHAYIALHTHSGQRAQGRDLRAYYTCHQRTHTTATKMKNSLCRFVSVSLFFIDVQFFVQRASQREVRPHRPNKSLTMLSTKFLYVALAGVFAALSVPTATAGQNPLTPASSLVCKSYASAPTAIATTPHLVKPEDIAIDGLGDIFVVDSLRADLIRIDAETSKSDVLLGKPWLEIPVGLTISPNHADLYVGDENTSTVWHIPCQSRGNNSCALYHKTPLNITLGTKVHPVGLQMDGDDHLFIADFNGQRVLRRDAFTGKITILLSPQNLPEIPSNFGPHDIAIDRENHQLHVTDRNNDDIWALRCSKLSQTGESCDV